MFLRHCITSSMSRTLASSSSKYSYFRTSTASAIVPVKQAPAALTFASTASRRSRVRSASLNGQPQVFLAAFLASCCCRLRADAASCPMWISSSAAAPPVSICTFVPVKHTLFVLVKQAPELAPFLQRSRHAALMRTADLSFVTWSLMHMLAERLLRQYSYFCTSKASKLSASFWRRA